MEDMYQSGYYRNNEDNKQGGDDAFAININLNGEKEWEDNIVNPSNEQFFAISAKTDSFITVGKFEGLEQQTNEIGAVSLEYDLKGKIIWSDSICEKTQLYNKVTVAEDGGSIAVGSFKGKLEIDSESAIGKKIKLASKGSTDALIVKYNSKGEVEWAKGFGGGAEEDFKDIIAVEDGYIVIGNINVLVNLNAPNIITVPAEETQNADSAITLTGKVKNNCLIVKYTKDGKVEWAKNLGETGDDVIRTIEKTYDSGYIIAGGFSGTLKIQESNTEDGNIINLTSLGGKDGIVIKFNEDNLIQWANSFGGNTNDSIYTISEENGKTFLALYSKGKVNLINTNGEKIEFSNTSWPGRFGYDILINLNEDGKVIWGFKIETSVDFNDVARVRSVDIKDEKYIITGTSNGLSKIHAEDTVSGEEINTGVPGMCYGYIVRATKDGLVEKCISNINTNNSGGVQGGPGGMLDISFTSDDGYIVAGGYGRIVYKYYNSSIRYG